ncbi:MAG: hypothetical protein NT154_31660 [Verrucomicrobia bacterium]|nr:hypothetical protein [Verrucomicrobiota bacterium]
MKTITSGCMAGAMLILATLAFAPTAGGQTLNPPWVYTLVDGSQLLDDCPICDHVSIPVPMRGTFRLRLLMQGPLFSTYAMEDISFRAGSPGGTTYQLTGQGIYVFGGEVANLQSLSLTLLIDDGANPVLGYFTNDSSFVTRRWPMMQISVTQTNGTAARVFHLGINAAPFREIWFSTVQPFTGGLWNPPTNALSAGDLLSSVGQVVKRNGHLCGRLGIMPLVPDLGLKDVGILPGGEIAFSIAQDIFSETLGRLHAGDLLTDRGRILRSNSNLLSAFMPSPVPPVGAGLAAVKVTDEGAVYFSVQTNFYSAKLGRVVQTGDLLDDSGDVVRSGAQLLANFNPAKPAADYGLSAVYLWPLNGEIWFSTTQGFVDSVSNYYAAGDLLSDQGYVVYRNAELVSAFAPAASGTNFGLDALYVITDVPPLGNGLGPAKLAQPQPTNQPPASLAFGWSAAGHVFQLERASNPAGPYLPASRIDTDGPFLDPGVLTNRAQAFYRLHQW